MPVAPNTGDKSNPEPSYTKGEQWISDADYDRIEKALSCLAEADGWLNDIDRDDDDVSLTCFQAQEAIATAMRKLKELV